VHWELVSGAGTIYSATVVHHPVSDLLNDLVPYTVVLVDLAEGVRVVSLLEDAADRAEASDLAGRKVRLMVRTDSDEPGRHTAVLT
jgi:uncharacterized OB-fold protein